MWKKFKSFIRWPWFKIVKVHVPEDMFASFGKEENAVLNDLMSAAAAVDDQDKQFIIQMNVPSDVKVKMSVLKTTILDAVTQRLATSYPEIQHILIKTVYKSK